MCTIEMVIIIYIYIYTQPNKLYLYSKDPAETKKQNAVRINNYNNSKKEKKSQLRCFGMITMQPKIKTKTKVKLSK